MGATVAISTAAVVAAFLFFGSSVGYGGLTAITIFTLLAFVTGALESSPKAGIGGSILFVAHLSAAITTGPLGASVVALLSSLLTQVWLRRESIKVLFNVAQVTLSVVVGSSFYLFAGGQLRSSNFSNQDFLAYAALVFGYFATNSAFVSGAVAISRGERFSEIWRSQIMRAAGYDLVASGLGLLIAWMYTRFGPLSIFAVTLPILALRQAYRDNLDLKKANEELVRHHRELLDYTVKQIEARDPYTSGHSRRVAEYAQILAEEAGLTAKQVEDVATAALLHDVGKVYHEFGSVLQKEGRLSYEEKLLLQSHPVRSAELIATIGSLRGAVESAVKHHHENYDGSGYPEGLRGESIPVGSRIIMIADTLDAMTTDRPYRKALPFDRVLEEFRKYSGKQFDPRLADLAMRSYAIRRCVIASSSPTSGLTSKKPTPPRPSIRVRA
ncbi:MAG: HD-GYP domain-containing protein [Gemmatimonadales bacterium]|nr:HD-GYP domain-containing protein [Gemmatimonadales bacterium]